jgi:UPF0042 nucleotide-binding protein
MPGKKDFLIVTGLSGAGLSSALKSLEDAGYEVMDNIPLSLLDTLIKDQDERPIAVGVDSRTRNFSPAKLKKAAKDLAAEILFITCEPAVLQKRFTETRRKHPLAKDRPVSDGIKKEQELMAPLQQSADLVIDTSELSIHDLRRTIDGYYADNANKKLSVNLISFGFRNGVPREADIVMDVRFLKNPHWDKKLKPLSGKDEKVGAYIRQDEGYAAFIENFKMLVEPLLSRYAHEGKSYLTLAFGCTGGKHRSVFMVETMEKWLKSLQKAQGLKIHKKHRDLEE